MPKILLLNLPSGPIPTDYPPVAISRIIEGIDPFLNCTVQFYNLDFYRYSLEEIQKKVSEFNPDIIGFSAILTTAYTYLKELSVAVRTACPKAVQILGGQMAVISNIILLRTQIDFCVIGESEPTFSNLIRALQTMQFKIIDMSKFREVKGIVFCENDVPYFTGFETENVKTGMSQLNYELISQYASIENYFHKVDGQYFRVRLMHNRFEDFISQVYPQNRDKNMATVFASKGCVGGCTFCHRYFRGYRVNPAEEVIEYITKLKKQMNVGLIMFSEENFGTNVKETAKITSFLKDAGLNWAAGAVRVKTVNEAIIKEWKDSGCVHINFGIETLSQKMLDVMDKRSTVEENISALQLCYKYKIFSTLGLVIGMPGETNKTIEETIQNAAQIIPNDLNIPFEMYINYVQAIPGTPIYEYARRIGYVGKTIEEQEEYIESLNDINAYDKGHYLNFTDYEKEESVYWRYYMLMEIIAAYYRKNGYINVLKNKKTRLFRICAIYILVPKFIRKTVLKYMVIIWAFGLKSLIKVLFKKVFARKSLKFSKISSSLKKVIKEIEYSDREDEACTASFRTGN